MHSFEIWGKKLWNQYSVVKQKFPITALKVGSKTKWSPSIFEPKQRACAVRSWLMCFNGLASSLVAYIAPCCFRIQRTELSACSVSKFSVFFNSLGLIMIYKDLSLGLQFQGSKLKKILSRHLATLIYWSHLLYPYFAFKSFTTLVFPPESEVGSLSSKPAKRPVSLKKLK